jgi:hypothetical protein
MPKIREMAVIRMGRRRTGPAMRMALSAGTPFSCSLLAKSTSKIEFLVARPMSMMNPIIAVMSMG